MSLIDLQKQIGILHQERGYTAGPQTLTLGAMEEMGELAQAILLTECADFKPSQKKLGRTDLVDVAHEIGDIITYLLGLCNALGIEPYFQWKE
jgi:NTP pyrophosphatase (non-canonical NTP hydrolase)